jgi:hypothetical protein
MFLPSIRKVYGFNLGVDTDYPEVFPLRNTKYVPCRGKDYPDRAQNIIRCSLLDHKLT